MKSPVVESLNNDLAICNRFNVLAVIPDERQVPVPKLCGRKRLDETALLTAAPWPYRPSTSMQESKASNRERGSVWRQLFFPVLLIVARQGSASRPIPKS